MFGNRGEQPWAPHRGPEEPPAAILSDHGIVATSCHAVRQYLEAVAQLNLRVPLVSVILFGSAAKADFVDEVSDVDLMIVVPDHASQADRREVQEKVIALETAHGFRVPPNRTHGWLQNCVERCVGYSLSGFVCSRGDLLSGDVARVFGISPFESIFVDRIVFAGVVASSVTVWGEELLAQVPVLPLRSFDVFKAMFSFVTGIVLCAAVFPVLPDATKYAMGILKHSLHSCYFCYHRKAAALEEEVGFFGSRVGKRRILNDLLARRRTYSPSFAFVWGCLPVLFQIHLRTARENRFPQLVLRA